MENNIDRLFKEKLKNHNPTMPGNAWEQMDALLSGEVKSRSKKKWWFFMMVGLLILFMGWYFSNYSYHPSHRETSKVVFNNSSKNDMQPSEPMNQVRTIKSEKTKEKLPLNMPEYRKVNSRVQHEKRAFDTKAKASYPIKESHSTISHTPQNYRGIDVQFTNVESKEIATQIQGRKPDQLIMESNHTNLRFSASKSIGPVEKKATTMTKIPQNDSDKDIARRSIRNINKLPQRVVNPLAQPMTIPLLPGIVIPSGKYPDSGIDVSIGINAGYDHGYLMDMGIYLEKQLGRFVLGSGVGVGYRQFSFQGEPLTSITKVYSFGSTEWIDYFSPSMSFDLEIPFHLWYPITNNLSIGIRGDIEYNIGLGGQYKKGGSGLESNVDFTWVDMTDYSRWSVAGWIGVRMKMWRKIDALAGISISQGITFPRGSSLYGPSPRVGLRYYLY